MSKSKHDPDQKILERLRQREAEGKPYKIKKVDGPSQPKTKEVRGRVQHTEEGLKLRDELAQGWAKNCKSEETEK